MPWGTSGARREYIVLGSRRHREGLAEKGRPNDQRHGSLFVPSNPTDVAPIFFTRPTPVHTTVPFRAPWRPIGWQGPLTQP